MDKGTFMGKCCNIAGCVTVENLKAFSDLYEEAVVNIGWHPASEVPPVDEFGESEYLIAYDLDGYAFSAFYSRKKGWCDDNGRDNLEIEWWCCPPQNN